MLQSDRLLYVLSARSKVPWPAFKQFYDRLCVVEQAGTSDGDANRERLRTMRALDALGHADFFFDEAGGGVYGAPPVLAALPVSGLPEAVLCGARAPETLDNLRSACGEEIGAVEIETTSHPDAPPLVPARLAVQAESDEALERVAGRLKIPYLHVPPARTLLEFAGGLGDYRTSLPRPHKGTLNWKRKDFDPHRLQFRQAEEEVTGFCLSECFDPGQGGRSRHFLFKDGERAEVDRDWGRYELLYRTSVNVLHYDPRRFLFAVPASAPLPRLLARALALCSGYAPRFIPCMQLDVRSPETWGFNLYGRVPPDIAKAIATKVAQPLQQVTLPVAPAEPSPAS